MTETFTKNNSNQIKNITNSIFPYQSFYTYDNIHLHNPLKSLTSLHKEKGYIFDDLKLMNGKLLTHNFKEHDIIYIPGFFNIVSTYCDETRDCSNKNGFGIVTQVYHDDKIEVFFGKNKYDNTNVIYLLDFTHIMLWLRTTNLDHVFLLSRSLSHTEGIELPDKLAKMLVDKNTSPQHLPSKSLIPRPTDADKPPPSFKNDDDDDIIDPDDLNFKNTFTFEDPNKANWKSVGPDTGGKKKLRKSKKLRTSKKNRKYKNKTIKGGQKNNKSEMIINKINIDEHNDDTEKKIFNYNIIVLR